MYLYTLKLLLSDGTERTLTSVPFYSGEASISVQVARVHMPDQEPVQVYDLPDMDAGEWYEDPVAS